MITASQILSELSSSYESDKEVEQEHYKPAIAVKSRRVESKQQQDVIDLDSESSNDSMSYYPISTTSFVNAKKRKMKKLTPRKNSKKKPTIEESVPTEWRTPDRRATKKRPLSDLLSETSKSPSGIQKKKRKMSANFKSLSPQQKLTIKSPNVKSTTHHLDKKLGKKSLSSKQLRISDMFKQKPVESVIYISSQVTQEPCKEQEKTPKLEKVSAARFDSTDKTMCSPMQMSPEPATPEKQTKTSGEQEASPDSLLDVQLIVTPNDKTPLDNSTSKRYCKEVTDGAQPTDLQTCHSPSLIIYSQNLFERDSLSQIDVNSQTSTLSLSLVIDSQEECFQAGSNNNQNAVDLLPRPASPVLPFISSFDFNDLEDDDTQASSNSLTIDQADNELELNYSLDFAEPTLQMLPDEDLFDHLDSDSGGSQIEDDWQGINRIEEIPTKSSDTEATHVVFDQIPAMQNPSNETEDENLTINNIIASLHPGMLEATAMNLSHSSQQLSRMFDDKCAHLFAPHSDTQQMEFNLIESQIQQVPPTRKASVRKLKVKNLVKQEAEQPNVVSEKVESPRSDEVIVTEEDKFKEIIELSQREAQHDQDAPSRLTRSKTRSTPVKPTPTSQFVSPTKKKFRPPRPLSSLKKEEPVKEKTTNKQKPATTIGKRIKATSNVVVKIDTVAIRECALCRTPRDDDFIGPISDLYFHTECIEYSGVSTDDKDGISNLYQQCTKYNCFHCKKSGASLKCAKKTCRVRYHLPCAQMLTTDGELPTIIDEKNCIMYCEPSHTSLNPSYF